MFLNCHTGSGPVAAYHNQTAAVIHSMSMSR